MDCEVKNLLRCQSKHGLMGSSAKTGKFFTEEGAKNMYFFGLKT